MRPRFRLPEVSERGRDWILAAGFLIALEVATLSGYDGHRALVANAIVAGAMALAFAWRHRAPLGFACTVMGLAVLSTATLTDIAPTFAGLYSTLVAPYVVASHDSSRRALAGLAVCTVGASIVLAVDYHTPGDWAFNIGIAGASWAIGRMLRTRRLLAGELERRAERIAAERESRALLAVADERSRIARELHALVAGRVSAMVVQSEVAERALDEHLDLARLAMSAVEETGRQALAEMRRVLGVLRRADDAAELAPQPGVGQVHALVEQARENGREVDLEVEGEPGPLPASVDLGLYRILEDALASAPGHAMSVVLRLGEREVGLEVVAFAAGVPPWPTAAMRERVAICDGELDVDQGAQRLRVRLPRVFEEVFA
jgi:signal transduction histidine kinase